MMFDSLRLEERWRLAREYCFYWRSCRNWRTVVRGRREGSAFDRFEFRSGSVLTFPDEPPWQLIDEIWRNQVYTRRPVQFHFEPRLIVDIGANIGTFALYAAARWPDASIHAFEPAPENIERLRQNVALSRTPGVVCHPSAVGATSGTTTFYLKADPGWHSIWGDTADTAITVKTTSLGEIADELDGQSIDLLKLDCEGAEYEILDGRESLLRDRVHQIAMEYHEVGGHSVQELTSLLDRAGFQCEIEPAPEWKTGMLYAVNRAVN
jgi:FkbM family methyltransferase